MRNSWPVLVQGKAINWIVTANKLIGVDIIQSLALANLYEKLWLSSVQFDPIGTSALHIYFVLPL